MHEITECFISHLVVSQEIPLGWDSGATVVSCHSQPGLSVCSCPCCYWGSLRFRSTGMLGTCYWPSLKDVWELSEPTHQELISQEDVPRPLRFSCCRYRTCLVLLKGPAQRADHICVLNSSDPEVFCPRKKNPLKSNSAVTQKHTKFSTQTTEPVKTKGLWRSPVCLSTH